MNCCAAAWLRASQPGASLADKIAWANGYEAIDYEHVQQDRKEEFILRLRDEAMPRGVVPEWACCLLMMRRLSPGTRLALNATC